MAAINIRNASLGDIAAIADIHQRAYINADKRLGSSPTVDLHRLQGWITYFQELAATESFVRVEVEPNSIVGFTTSCVHRSENERTSGEVESLFVAPSHQGKRIGKQLFNDAVKPLHQCGCDNVFLYSDLQDSLLQAWYKNCGGVHTGEILDLPGNRIPQLGKIVFSIPGLG